MPDAGLKNLLDLALRNHILTPAESTRISAYVTTHGADQDKVDQVVAAIRDAVNADGDKALKLTDDRRRATVNQLLGTLDGLKTLSLPHDGAKLPDGSVDWIAALKTQQGGGAVGDGLPKKSLLGSKISIGADGSLSLGPTKLGLDLAAPTEPMLEALVALGRPGQLGDLAAAKKTALTDTLITQLGAALPVKNDAPGKFKRVVGATASLGALDAMATSLSSDQADKLLARYTDVPSPLAQALLIRALEHAKLSDAQKQKLAALAKPEGKDVLLKAYDALQGGTQQIDWATPDGPATQFALTALALGKDQTSVDNIFSGMSTYKGISPGSNGWDAEALGQMKKFLEAYCDGYPQTAFLFGTFVSDAPKNVAKITNARIVPGLAAALGGAKPAIGGVPLAPAQIDLVKKLLPGLKDDNAVKGLAQAIAEANDILSKTAHSSWEDAPKPNAPLATAAWALFERNAVRALEAMGGTKDGMIDVDGLTRDIKAEASAVSESLRPHLVALAANPPSFDGIELTADAAKTITSLLSEHLKSEMTVGNIGGALKVIADAHGGHIDAAGHAQLQSIVGDYMKNWPNTQVFDFNKLGRIASFAVQGKEVPLCTLNGKKVGLADFYLEVGKSVAASIQMKPDDYAWLADHWGFRAKETVELLDVFAQMTAEKSGPIVALQKQYPGKAITVEATGHSGAHEQFIFNVAGAGRFNQGSDGKVTAYSGDPEPILFTATVKDDGSFDVQAPAAGTHRIERWPLLRPYSVGDSVDIRSIDPAAVQVVEKAVEGQPFATKYVVLPARIESYDAKGNYVVSYKKADGTATQKTLTIDQIKTDNNPHDFPLTGSTYGDEISVNVKTDAVLKDFIDGAKAIIQKYLPSDGSILQLTSAQLAKAQKACVTDLMAYTTEAMSYPAEKNENPDEAAKKYHELIDGLSWGQTLPFGELLKIKKGVCRHQCLAEQLINQFAGIDSRLASGAANTETGVFRGFHIWDEIKLADSSRFLSDQTWDDAAIPLWRGAYDTDKRRVEMYSRTAQYDSEIVTTG